MLGAAGVHLEEAQRIREAVVVERVAGEVWRSEKDALLESINRDGFWSSDDRFTTLDRMERMDRVAAETEGACSSMRGRHPLQWCRGSVAAETEPPRRTGCTGS